MLLSCRFNSFKRLLLIPFFFTESTSVDNKAHKSALKAFSTFAVAITTEYGNKDGTVTTTTTERKRNVVNVTSMTLR